MCLSSDRECLFLAKMCELSITSKDSHIAFRAINSLHSFLQYHKNSLSKVILCNSQFVDFDWALKCSGY